MSNRQVEQQKATLNDVLRLHPKNNWEKEVDPSSIYRIPNSTSILIVSPNDETLCQKSSCEVHNTSTIEESTEQSEAPPIRFDRKFVETEIKNWTLHQKTILEMMRNNSFTNTHEDEDSKDPFNLKNTGINGPFLIFNFQHFNNSSCFTKGSNMALNMAQTAIYIGFSPVRIYNDLSRMQTVFLHDKISQARFDDINCVGCYVSSHGNMNNQFYFQSGETSFVQDFEDYIGGRHCGKYKSNCSAPRMFFYDICLGTQHGSSKELTDSNTTMSEPIENYFNKATSVPESADVLTIFSTTRGYYAYEQAFNHCLCKALKEHCNIELSQIVRMINKEMGTFEAEKDKVKIKQMPTPIYKMTEEFYFYPRKQIAD